MSAHRTAEVTAAPVYAIAQFLADPHVRRRGMVAELPDPKLGSVLMPDVVPRLPATPGRLRYSPPHGPAHPRIAVLDRMQRGRARRSRRVAQG